MPDAGMGSVPGGGPVTGEELAPDEGRPFGDDPLEERVVESDLVRRGRIIEFRVDTVERADGSLATRDTVRHPGAVAVLALDDAGRLLLVRQWRVATGRALLEVPAGTLDVHDGVTEDPAEAARRELEEETGHRAASWRRLATFWTAPGFATEVMHLYLATGLDGVADGDGRLTPDEDERLELHRVRLDEALAMVERGDLADAKSMVGILLLDRLRREGRLPEAPAGVPEALPAAAAPASDPEAIHLRFGFTPLEFARANAAFLRRQRSSLIVGWGSVALTVVNLLTFRDPLLATTMLVLGAGFLTGWLVVPFVWWQFRRKSTMFAHLEAGVDGSGITSNWPAGGGTVSWDGIERIETASGWVFVRTAAGVAWPIPGRAFAPDELRAFQRHALRHGLTLDGHRVEPAAR